MRSWNSAKWLRLQHGKNGFELILYKYFQGNNRKALLDFRTIVLYNRYICSQPWQYLTGKILISCVD
jgi:hypothetical protein